MDRYRENTSAFFTWLAYCLGWKRCPGRSPAPQTSLIFELPDELILSILSYISPDPWLPGHSTWFRIPYSMMADDSYNQRVGFLRPLSMTCWAMRLRLLPWVWEHLVFPQWNSEQAFTARTNKIVNASHADKFLATNVKFMTVYLTWNTSTLPLFVKCLECFPNLHTLFIGSVGDYFTTPLMNALEGVELPRIKTLILPPAAYPLLQHCRNVEDVAYVVRCEGTSSDGILEPLASNRDSKVKRLAIPLGLWTDASKSVAACSRLTELTIISRYQYGAKRAETTIQLDQAERARSALLKLVVACKVLPYFDTLQIVRIPAVPRHQACWCRWDGCGRRMDSSEQGEQMMRERTKHIAGWAVDCLKEPQAMDQERKRITLRVFKFNPGRPCDSPPEVEEYEVQEFEGEDP